MALPRELDERLGLSALIERYSPIPAPGAENGCYVTYDLRPRLGGGSHTLWHASLRAAA